MKPNATSAAGAQTVKTPTVTGMAVLPKSEAMTGKTTELKSENVLELKPEKKVPTIEDLKFKIEKSHLLSEKHAKLTAKLASLEMFAIKRDVDTARMRVTDARGETFESSNPVSIGKLIEIWKETYVNAINEVENDMFNLMAN